MEISTISGGVVGRDDGAVLGVRLGVRESEKGVDGRDSSSRYVVFELFMLKKGEH